MGSLPTLKYIQEALYRGILTSTELIKGSVLRIEDPNGEGSKAFIKVNTAHALEQASAADTLFRSGLNPLPLQGIPISVKDLFDVKGEQTKAGSVVLDESEPASSNATIIQRLVQAGAILIGRTSMTEFAYSGVGLNPHYGTPASPYEREKRRIPGGSSSGSGVSVADQMAFASIGTDTGGSVRIPAALCGITGFKPTASRVPTEGVFPLSSTFDSVGPLAPSVECCATLDQIMRGVPVSSLTPFPLKNLRVAIPKGLPLDHLDSHVSASFERALKIVEKGGAVLSEIKVHGIEDVNRPTSGARLLAAEAYSVHRSLLEQGSQLYDPRVSTRILPAADTSAADYIDLLTWRKSFLSTIREELHSFDAILMPTTPIIAPPITELEESDAVYFETNTLMLRNTCIVNQMDGCALSIPCHKEGEPPVGLMLAGLPLQDEKILQIGLTIEKLLNQ